MECKLKLEMKKITPNGVQCTCNVYWGDTYITWFNANMVIKPCFEMFLMKDNIFYKPEDLVQLALQEKRANIEAYIDNLKQELDEINFILNDKAKISVTLEE